MKHLLARKSLAFLPTPIIKLERLSKFLGGPSIYMKRDDQTGLALGGNKTRKLEFLLGDAIAKGCDTVITGGAEQSNHCRQTAAAAAMAGLECHLVLGGEVPDIPDGNYLLDALLGATAHWTGEFRKGEKIPEITEELTMQGKKVYMIPYGGSSPIGAAGYVVAMQEMDSQLRAMNLNISAMVFASSSGGTQAGMTVGGTMINFGGDIHGVKIDKEELGETPYLELLADLSNKTAELFNLDKIFNGSDFLVNNDYLGKGYGVISDLEREAIQLCARLEGILLDPVYTARAFGGLVDLIRQGNYTEKDNLLFWHTGGAPALFHYGKEVCCGPKIKDEIQQCK